MQSSYIILKKYDIILITFLSHVEEDTFVGNCNMSIWITQRIQKIQLYLDVQRVVDIKMINDPLKFTSDGEMIVYKLVEPSYEMNITEYLFQDNVLPGEYIIKLTYIVTDDTGLKKFYKRNKRQW